MNSSAVETDPDNCYQREIINEIEKMTLDEQKTIYEIIKSVMSFPRTKS
jgi:hypothetical protein